MPKIVPPYYWLFNSMARVAKSNGQKFELTFDQFLEFVKVTNCHYCGRGIEWPERAFKKLSKRRYSHSRRAYYLDRKDNSKGYEFDNCVVCCTVCNAVKGATLTFDEMLLLRDGLARIAQKQSQQ